MKIENRQQFLVTLTIAAGALYVGVNFIYGPLADWYAARSAQIKDLRARVSEGRSLLARDTAVQNHWNDMQSNSLPADTSLAEQRLLKAVDEWSRDCGAEVTSLMPQWKNDSTNYLTLTCRVETSGDLGALTRFLYDLEKGPLAIRLDSVELGAHDNTGQQMTMSVDIDGLALSAKETK